MQDGFASMMGVFYYDKGVRNDFHLPSFFVINLSGSNTDGFIVAFELAKLFMELFLK